ncbi:putative RNA-directed DNA polymerase from transposon BS [Trichonephila clavipes]|nr:putative RNA-directed DNA polymerase from transposon BS [Trichonephila clavipes]
MIRGRLELTYAATSMPKLQIPSFGDVCRLLSYSQPQADPCNTVLNPVGKIPHDGKAAANILGEFYKNMNNLTFKQDNVLVKNKSKRLIHNCRSNRFRLPIFNDNFLLRELNITLKAMDLIKSPGPDCIHGAMIDHLGPHGMRRLLDLFNLSW